MSAPVFENIYGAPPAELIGDCAGARQFSPLFPGASDLAEVAAGTLNGLALLAPSGTIERRYAIAQALRAVAPGAPLSVLALKDKGGSRLGGDLALLGAACEETARRHYRICALRGGGDERAIDAALRGGEPRFLSQIALWSQPGVFSWDRIDPGSALLINHMPSFSGAGADFGCGLGVLARAALASSTISLLTLLDIDRRAIAMARRNIVDPRVRFLWADARLEKLAGLDFIIMNPPFHDGGIESQALGQTFIACAAASLRAGGALWLTANRHLPYEAILRQHFRRVSLEAEAGGFKIFQAAK